MKLSIQIAVILIVILLVLASLVAVYLAMGNEEITPLALVAGVNIIAVILLTFLITRSIIQPLNHIQSIMKKVEEGDLTPRVNLKTMKEMEEVGNAFNEMIARLQVVQDMKTEFVSMAAHQLRTPLSGIKWSTGMLLDGDAGAVSTEQKELLEKSFQSTERMILLINDLLNVTKIEEGRYLYAPSFQQVGEIVKSMVEVYQDKAKQQKIGLELKVPEQEIPWVFVDEEKLRLVLQNLIENAFHYTKEGGKVTVKITRDTKEIKVAVVDTGIGIPKKQQARVFEKFFRATNARAKRTDGSGLGLYLAHNIITAHGGRIWFRSKEGEGTTVTFALPL